MSALSPRSIAIIKKVGAERTSFAGGAFLLTSGEPYTVIRTEDMEALLAEATRLAAIDYGHDHRMESWFHTLDDGKFRVNGTQEAIEYVLATEKALATVNAELKRVIAERDSLLAVRAMEPPAPPARDSLPQFRDFLADRLGQVHGAIVPSDSISTAVFDYLDQLRDRIQTPDAFREEPRPCPWFRNLGYNPAPGRTVDVIWNSGKETGSLAADEIHWAADSDRPSSVNTWRLSA